MHVNDTSSIQEPKKIQTENQVYTNQNEKKVYNMIQKSSKPTQKGKQTPSSPRKRAKVA